MISPIFDEASWTVVQEFDFKDITYHRHHALGVVRIAFDRPESVKVLGNSVSSDNND